MNNPKPSTQTIQWIKILNIFLFLLLLWVLISALPFLLGVSYMYQISALTYWVWGVVFATFITAIAIFYCAYKAKQLNDKRPKTALLISGIPTAMIVALFLLVHFQNFNH